jgi:hypothetical protein
VVDPVIDHVAEVRAVGFATVNEGMPATDGFDPKPGSVELLVG